MNGKFFLDTNILVYAYSTSDPTKSQQARALNQPAHGWISTQVLTELANVLTRKFKLGWPVVTVILEDIIDSFPVHTNTPATLLRATQVAQRYGFSWFDSLIVAAALECGCQTLYSEDLQHGQLLDNGLRVLNPFQP